MQGESRLAGLRELVRTNGEIKNIDSGRSVRRRRAWCSGGAHRDAWVRRPDYAVGYALADKPEGPWRKSASYVRVLDMLGPILTKHYPTPIFDGSI